MFERWGRFAVRHNILIPLVLVILIAGLFASAGSQLSQRLSQEGWDDPDSASTAAAKLESEIFGRENSGDVVLVLTAPPGERIDTPARLAAIDAHVKKLQSTYPEQIDHLTAYTTAKSSQLLSPDGSRTFIAIGLKGEHEAVLNNFRAIELQLPGYSDPGELSAAAKKHPHPLPLEESGFYSAELAAAGVTQEVAGQTAIAGALDAGMSGDIARAELYGLPAVAILLILVFGSLVAATMPLIIGVMSILGSLGLLSILATFTQVNVFAQSVVTLLGLGLAIDYGLFMVSRFREELDSGASVAEAAVTATATAGKTVVFSAAMVAVALSGLLLFPQAFLKSVAYGAMSAVGLAALLSLTILPCLFARLGRRIDAFALRRPPLDEAAVDASWWARIPAWAMRHAGVVTAGIVTVLIALSLPFVGIKFGGINETYLPPDNATRLAQQHFDESFPQFRTDPVKLIISGADNAQLGAIYQQANAVTGLTGRFSPARPTTDGVTVLTAGVADRAYNEAVIEQLRALEVPAGVEVLIGGTPALEIESIEALFDTLPLMALYVIGVTFILMALVFGSLILPAKAIIMTVLGLGATLGVLTTLFVAGAGATLFNFTPGPLMSPVLVLIMAIIYGLSTDYEVFLLSRMVEAKERGATTDAAIRQGTAHTGNIITAAALIMIVVCGAFGFSEIVMMKYIAFGMITALVLDATVIRMLLVPAVMHLLREDNWWAPRFVKQAAAIIGHNTVMSRSQVVAHPQAEERRAAAELPLSQVRISDSAEARRAGRSTNQDPELIPFAELKARLEATAADSDTAAER